MTDCGKFDFILTDSEQRDKCSVTKFLQFHLQQEPSTYIDKDAESWTGLCLKEEEA